MFDVRQWLLVNGSTAYLMSLLQNHPSIIFVIFILFALYDKWEIIKSSLNTVLYNRLSTIDLVGHVYTNSYSVYASMSQEMKAVLYMIHTNSSKLRTKTLTSLCIDKEIQFLLPINNSWVKINDTTYVKIKLSKSDTLDVVKNSAMHYEYTVTIGHTIDFESANNYINTCVQSFKDNFSYNQNASNCVIELMGYDASPQYKISRFTSSKTFDNTPFENALMLKSILDEFMSRTGLERSQRIGKQHAIGFLFHGPPGTCKTSAIKAIANYTNRHIVSIRITSQMRNVSIREILRTIMTCEYIGSQIIPLNKRIYVFEEADTWLDNINILKDNEDNKKMMNDTSGLGDFLDVIDGLVEYDGRICIMTTNNIDKIPPALCRGGRFKKVEFSSCTPNDVRTSYELYYQTKLDNNVIIPNGEWTLAELASIFETSDATKAMQIISSKHKVDV